MKGNEALTDALAKDTKEFVFSVFEDERLITEYEFKNKLSEYLTDKIYEITQRKPMIIPVIRDFNILP